MLLFLLSTLEPIVRSSRDRRILCGNSFAGFDVTFWETPRSVSLACVCLIDNMRWKHLAVLFVRRRTRFFELVHPSHRKPVRLEAFPFAFLFFLIPAPVKQTRDRDVLSNKWEKKSKEEKTRATSSSAFAERLEDPLAVCRFLSTPLFYVFVPKL